MALGRPRTRPDTKINNKRRLDDLQRYYAVDPMIGWARNALMNAKRRAKQRGLSFNLSLEDVLRAAQGVTHCPITGALLEYRRGGGIALKSAASIDRIDNTSGYAPDSIAVISSWANLLKNNASLEEMINMGDYAKTLQNNKSMDES